MPGGPDGLPTKPTKVRWATKLTYSAFLATSLLGSPGAVGGQSIHGRVLLEKDSIGVEGVELALIDSTGNPLLRVQSDSLGMFRIPAPRPGAYGVLASRLGFAPVRAEVEVRDREIVEVEIRMAEEAIPLDPILVVARREIRHGTLDEFYDRMDRNKQRGVGWYFTRDEIEKRENTRLPFFLSSASGLFLSGAGESVLMRGGGSRGGYCTPTIVLDGYETHYRELQMMDLEGIEIYRGRFENVEGYFPSDCGFIFLWRRPDWGNPFNWGRLALAGGLLALLVGIGSLF